MAQARIPKLVCASVLIASASCNDADPTPDSGSEAREAQRLAAVVARVQQAPLVHAAAHAVVRTWPQVLPCPPTYDLGDVSGSCVRLVTTGYYYDTSFERVVYTLSNRAIVQGGGSPFELTFDLRVQPAGDHDYSLNVWDAHANVTEGSGAWSLDGSASVDASGTPGNVEGTLRTSDAHWRLRDRGLEFQDARLPVMTVRLEIDSGVGEIVSEGVPIAAFSVSGGCVLVDYVSPARTDENTCMW